MTEEHWEEDFDFYLTRFDDDPVSVFVDLGVGKVAPLPGYPCRVRLITPMKSPRPDGLRGQGESEELFALEDRLIDALGADAGLVFVGRVVLRGITDLVFYGPAESSSPALAGRVRELQRDYQVDLQVESDPEWKFYWDVLCPDPYSYQLIMNRRVMRQLSEAGDDPTIPRPVDHVAFLADQEAALQAAAELRAAGFDVQELAAVDDGTFRVAFRDETTLHEGRIEQRVAQILDVVLVHEGRYDGWGCPVMR